MKVATEHANFDVLFLDLSCTRRIRRKDKITVIFNVSPEFSSQRVLRVSRLCILYSFKQTLFNFLLSDTAKF